MAATAPGDRSVLVDAVRRVERTTGRRLPAVSLVRDEPFAPAGRRRLLASASAGTVRLPAAAGPLSAPAAAGLLAHELTHVAQQAAGPVPGQDTPAGRRLELAARRAEQAAGGRRAPGALPATPAYHVWADLDAATPPLPPVRRSAPAADPRPAADPTPEAAPAPAPTPAAASVQHAVPDPVATVPDGPAPEAAPFSLDALGPEQLDRLASRLYPRLRSRIRGELLSDRDRVPDRIGLLS